MSSRSLKALTFLFFVLLCGIVAVLTLYTRTQQIEKANRVFQTLVPLTEQFVQTYQTMDTGLRAKSSSVLFSVLANNTAADIVVVHDSKGEALLLWQAVPTTSLGISRSPSYTLPQASFQTVIFETSLPGAIHLVASFHLLGPEEIRSLAFVALALLGVWALFLLLNLLLGNGGKPHQEQNAVSLPERQDQDPIQEPAPAQEASPPPPEQTSDASTLADLASVDSQIGTNDEALAPTSREERDSRFVLIDRKTGVTQERFLRFRLDKELERNAENALDLSVALFNFKGLAKDDFAHAASLLLSEFSHEDLIFEYGAETFCVVLPQHDLDQAIARSELVMRKVDGQRETGFRQAFELTVGLSSRNGRLIDSPRFLKECVVALRKASREEGRIVGFRPDPVRFRNFLRHQRV